MRSLMGILWALGGSVVGFILGAIIALAIAKATNASNREGAHGFYMVGLGLIGAVIGLVIGLVLYARTAPSGQGVAFIGSGTMGVLGLVAAIGVSLWAFMQLREAPLEYGGSLANLEMELRILTTALPTDANASWLDIEVQTAKTRPVGTVLWSSRRTEGAHTIIPVVQGPLYRAGSRFIVVRIADRQDEMFMPPMKRTPNPKADWSEWYAPRSVEPPYGVTPPAPLTALFQLRYRVRAYGDVE